MTRRRVYLLIAALGLVGVTVVGVLNSVRRENSARLDRELHEFDWGLPFSGPVSLSAIRIVGSFDAGERGFSYYTGGYSPGSGESTKAPNRVIAEAAHGVVTVRLRAFDPYTSERAGDDASEMARIVSLATTRVWPAQPTPVEVDVHLIPNAAPFSLAKRVDWEEGDRYEIAVFERENPPLELGTPAHELYHALAGRWSLGLKNPAQGHRRPSAAHTYEELAATLFAECGRLLANGSLSRDTRSVTITIDGQPFEDILDGEELGRALDLLSRDVRGSHLLRGLLARTVLNEVFGAEEAIALESPQGEKLLARCRESAANPMLLEFRLAEMLKRSEQPPEPSALGE